MATGYIYALDNPAMPGIVKIGRTGRDPHKRRSELSGATGVPLPFRLAYFRAVPDMQAAEQSVHAYFEQQGKRVSHSREFFAITIEKAIEEIDAVWRAQNQQTLDHLLEMGFPDEEDLDIQWELL